MPQCSCCVKSKVDCEYEKPKFIATKDLMYKPYAKKTKPMIPIQRPKSWLDRDTLLLEISMEIPVLKKDKISFILSYISYELNGVAIFTTPPKADELALVYAICASFNKRCNYAEAANFMFERSRSLLAPMIETVQSNILVATCCSFLAMYLGSIGDVDRARFYQELCCQYLVAWQQQQQCETGYRLLMNLYHAVNFNLEGEESMSRVVKLHMSQHYIRKGYYENQQENEESVRVMLETEIGGFNELSLIKRDVCQRENQYDLDGNRIAQLSNGFSNMYDRMKIIGLPGEFVNGKKLVLLSFVHGVQLQQSLEAGHDELAKTFADKIACMTNVPGFVDTMLLVGTVVTLAAKAHLRFAKVSRSNTELFGISARMNEEYTTLQFISGHNTLLKTRCTSVVDELARELRRIDERIMQTRVQTYYTHPIVPVVAFEQEKETTGTEIDALEQFFIDFAS